MFKDVLLSMLFPCLSFDSHDSEVFFCMMSDVSSRQKFCKCPHRRYRISHIGKSLFSLATTLLSFSLRIDKTISATCVSSSVAFSLPRPFETPHGKGGEGRGRRKKGIFTDAQNGRPPPPSFSLPVFYCVSTEEKKCSQVMLSYLIFQRTN